MSALRSLRIGAAALDGRSGWCPGLNGVAWLAERGNKYFIHAIGESIVAANRRVLVTTVLDAGLADRSAVDAARIEP